MNAGLHRAGKQHVRKTFGHLSGRQVEHKPAMCLWSKEAGGILGFLRRVANPLLSAVEARLGVLCSALGWSPVQKRHGKDERAGTAQSGVDKVQGESQGKVQIRQSQAFHRVLINKARHTDHKLKHSRFSLNIMKEFFSSVRVTKNLDKGTRFQGKIWILHPRKH